jgi:hypothetical protein
VGKVADSRKAEVNFSDFEAVDFSDSGLVLDGDSEAFAKWYLEKTKSLAPLDDIKEDT